ncbi:MAG: hypothetical protein ACI39U_08585 [Candidatus Cryptobacteroides sp.]
MKLFDRKQQLATLRADDKNAEIIEVKRNPDKYDRKLLDEKTAFFKTKEKRLRKFFISTRFLSMEDM